MNRKYLFVFLYIIMQIGFRAFGVIDLTEEEKVWLSNHKLIKVGSDYQAPPFDFMENGKHSGISSEYIERFEKELGVKFEYITGLNWTQTLEKIRSKEIDVVANLAKNSERAEYIDFTLPIASFPTVIFVRNSNDDIVKVEDFKIKKLAVSENYYTHQDLMKNYPDIEPVLVANPDEGLKAVSFGKVDAYLGHLGIGSFQMHKNGITNLKVAFEYSTENSEFYIGIRDDWQILTGILDKVIESVPETEKIEIARRWVPVLSNQTREAEKKELINLTIEEMKWLSQHKKIRLSGDPDWLPHEAFNEKGEFIGIIPEIIKKIEERLPLEFEIIQNKTWTETLNMAKSKEVDVISAINNEARREYLNFTDTYLDYPIVIVTKKDFKNISDTSELRGNKVGLPRNYGYVKRVKDKYTTINFVDVESVSEGLMKVSTGELDAFIANISTSIYMIQEQTLINLKINGKTDLEMSIGLGVRDDWPILRDILNKAIDSISEREINEIKKKWVGNNLEGIITKTEVAGDLAKLAGQFLLIIFLITLMIILLMKLLNVKSLDKLKYGSHRSKNIAIITISTVIAVIIIATWIILERIKSDTKRRARYSIETVLNTTNDAINMWIDNNIKQLEYSASQPKFIELVEELLKVPRDKNVLKKSVELQNIRKYLSENNYKTNSVGFFIIAPDYINIGSRRDANMGDINLISKQRKKLLDDVFAGENRFIPPIRSDVLVLETDEKIPPTMFYATPIKNSSGKVIAVLTQREVPTEYFDRLFRLGRVGNTGETYSFDINGRLISDSRFDNQLRKVGLLADDANSMLEVEILDPGVDLTKGHTPRLAKEDMKLTLMAENAIKGFSGVNIDGYRDYRGVEVAGSWIWNNKYNFGLTTEMDYEEAMAPYTSTRNVVILLVFLTVILTIGLTLISILIGERANQALTKANEELEDRVESRTKELSSANKNLEATLEALTHPFYVIDAKTREIVLANSAAKELSPDGKITTCYKLTHKLDEPCSGLDDPCPLVEIKRTKKPYKVEHTHYDKNNNPIFVEVSGYPIFDENGELIRMIEYSQDITKRKLAEKAILEAKNKAEEMLRVQQKLEKKLKENVEFMQTMIEHLPAAVFAKDIEKDYKFVLWNRTCETLFGMQSKNMLGKTDYDIFPANEADFFRNTDEEVVRKDKVEIIPEETVTTTEGEKILTTIKVIVKDEGKPKTLLGITQDITERKRQEEKLRKALERVETLYKASLALRGTMSLNEILEIILDRLQRVVAFDSASVQQLYGEKFRIIYLKGFENSDEVLGLEFDTHSNNLAKKVAEIKEPMVVDDITQYDEFIDMSKDSDIKSWMAIPLIFNDEIIGQLTLDSNDIAFFDEEMAELCNAFATQAAIAIRNAQYFEELKIAKEEAEAATKAKGDFLANMSHEIRTPMNAIIGLNSLLERTELNAKQKDYVSKVSGAANNLLGIINDILDFSKIEAGKLSIEKIDFDLDDVLDNISNVLGLKAYDKGIEFLIIKENDVPVNLIGDPLRMGQVLLNLANNSIKFTEHGEVTLKVKVEKDMNNNKVLLHFAVKDTGIGMTPEQMERLFKAFSQADTSTTRKFGGTGLGLTISKRLVELMNGEIGVESEYGIGSTFYFTAEFEIGKEKKKKLNIIPESLKELSILVVDDNNSAREVLGNYLETFSYSPVLVSSGEEAISEIKNNHYDLVFMDWKMSGLDGISTWRHIKKTMDEEELPKAILVTAYGKEEINKQAREEGFQELLSKPISQSVLFDSIALSFGEKVEERENKNSDDIYPEGFDGVRGAKILLVEDNEINQQVAKETLELEGFWVDIAENGQIAFSKVNEKDYDLVLMDLQMPVLDGYKASRKIRGLSKFEDLKIIALSADAMSGTRQRVLESGMNDFITKPIEKQDLFEALAKWIEAGEREQNQVDINNQELISQEDIESILGNVDVYDGLRRVSGNVELFVDILVRFSKKNQNFNDEFMALIDGNKEEESRRMIHTLKGVAGNLGAKTLHYYAKELESEIQKDEYDDEQVKNILMNVNTELLGLIQQIDEVAKKVDEIKKKNKKESAELPLEELISKFEEMRNFIEEYDTEAEEVFNELKEYMENYDFYNTFVELGDSIVEYEFEKALELCDEIIEELKK